MLSSASGRDGSTSKRAPKISEKDYHPLTAPYLRWLVESAYRPGEGGALVSPHSHIPFYLRLLAQDKRFMSHTSVATIKLDDSPPDESTSSLRVRMDHQTMHSRYLPLYYLLTLCLFSVGGPSAEGLHLLGHQHGAHRLGAPHPQCLFSVRMCQLPPSINFMHR